jgi:hypothetical protein
MASWLSEREQRLVAGAETASADTPIPTQIVSNGEYLPPPQSEIQKRVERRTMELADEHGKRLGLDRRKFLRTSATCPAAFLMKQITASTCSGRRAERDGQPELMLARARSGRTIHPGARRYAHGGKRRELRGSANSPPSIGTRC